MLFQTEPLNIIDVPADRNHYSSDRLGYRFIVLHHTGGYDSRQWLSTTSPLSDPVSCHRLIGRDGVIYKIVPDNLVAFTQGPSHLGGITENLNRWALSIELENNGVGQLYSIQQLESAALQIVEWYGAYGVLPILHHYDIDTNKHDPSFFPQASFDLILLRALKPYVNVL